MKKFFKNNINKIVAFIIPVLIIFLIFLSSNIGIGLEKNVLIADLYNQYFPFLNYIKVGLFDYKTYSYTFSNGLGGGMFGAITYFIFSPIYILTILLNKADLANFAYLVILLKIGLCGFTMYYYLSKHFKDNNILYILFSTIYALSGYMIVNYYNILWLTGVYMFPLIVYSLEELVKNKKIIPYIFYLSYTLIFCYYIGYMICIFSCIYLLYLLILNYDWKNDKEKIIKIAIRFILSSLISGLISMIILIPTYLDLTEGFKLGMESSYFNYPSTVFEVLSRLYIGNANTDTITIFPLPNIYVTMLILPLVYFYFVAIKNKEKYASLGILIIMISAFFLPFINYVWHGFNFPNWLNYRFSFMIIFLLIIFAVKGLKNIDKINIIHYAIYIFVYLIISIILIFINYEWLSIGSIIISIMYTFAYLLLIYFSKNKKVLLSIIFILVLIEIFINGFKTFSTYNFQYNKEYYDTYKINNKLINKYLPSDNQFYRSDKTYFTRVDDNYVYGNYGVTNFTSTYRKNVNSFLRRIGFLVSSNTSKYSLGTLPIFNSLFDIKYIFVLGINEGNVFKNIYNNIDSIPYSSSYGKDYGNYSQVINVFENSHSLSLGYMVNSKIKELKYDVSTPGIEYQKDIFSSMIDNEINSVKKIEPIDKNKYKLENESVYYISLKLKKNNYTKIRDMRDLCYEIQLKINGAIVSTIMDLTSELIPIPEQFKNQEVTIEFITIKGDREVEDFSVYSIDKTKFEEEISLLENNLMEIEKFDTTYIKGKINVDSDKTTFFSSIPYERGWEVFVDGEKTKIIELLDTFIGFDLEEGEHTIEFKYHVPGLKIGAVVSLIGLILFGLYIKFNKKIEEILIYIFNKHEELIMYLIIGLLTVIINFAIYKLLSSWYNINYLISNFFSWIIAFLFAFFGSRRYVFEERDKNKKIYKELIDFFLSRIFTLAVDMGLMYLLVSVIKLNDSLVKVLVQVLVVIINYLTSKLIVFKKKAK